MLLTLCLLLADTKHSLLYRSYYHRCFDSVQVSCYAGHPVSTPSSTAIPLRPVQGQEHTFQALDIIPDVDQAALPGADHSASCTDSQDESCDDDNAPCSDSPPVPHQVHGPATLPQAIATSIQQAAYDGGSSDNLAVVVLDIASGAMRSLSAQDAAQSDASVSSTCQAFGAMGTSSQYKSDLLPLQQQQHQQHESEQEQQQQRQQQQQQRIVAGHVHEADIDFSTNAQQTTSSHPEEPLSGHALPAEHLNFQTSSLADMPGITLWQDDSQLASGTLIGRADGPQSYRLLDQVAQLPRYADHIHTSWLGLPILSSLSLWIQPHWPNPATSGWLTPPFIPSPQHASWEEDGVDSWEHDLAVHGSSSQLMLSPGSMLQLAYQKRWTPQSCSWVSADSTPSTPSTPCTVWDSAYPDAVSHSAAWLNGAASAMAQVVAAMPVDTDTEHTDGYDQAWSADGMLKQMDLSAGGNGSYLQPVPALQRGWQKYERGRNFARGSFGEVWHAEQAAEGEAFSLDPGCG